VFAEVGWVAKMRAMLFEKSMASFELLRCELETRFNAERVTVRTEDGVNLD
jgi:hypothetical protein